MGTLVLELGIGLGHSSPGRLVLIPHPGIGIGYWIGSEFIQHVHMTVKNIVRYGYPCIGIKYWIGS